MNVAVRRKVIPVSAPVGFNKSASRLRYFAVFRKAAAQLIGDVHSHVARPTFHGIEGDDADWIVELALHQITDKCVAVSSVLVGLTPRPPPSLTARTGSTSSSATATASGLSGMATGFA